MSKMSELNQVLFELKGCGKTLMNIADSLTEIFSSKDSDKGDVGNTRSTDGRTNTRVIVLGCS